MDNRIPQPMPRQKSPANDPNQRPARPQRHKPLRARTRKVPLGNAVSRVRSKRQTDRWPDRTSTARLGEQGAVLLKRQRGTRRDNAGPAVGPATCEPSGRRAALRWAPNARHGAGVFADVVDVKDMVNILADRDAKRPCSLTSWTPESRVDIRVTHAPLAGPARKG